ncbi:MFS transporter [Streptodolium elevatio]
MNPPETAASATPTSPAAGPVRLTRDRATWLLYLQTAVFAYFLYCFGPSVPLLGDDLEVSKAVAGLHSTAYAAGGAIVGALGSRPVLWWGRGPALWGGFTLLAAGVLMYALSPWLALTLAGALLCGLGGFAVVNLAAAAIVDHHGAVAGPGALSEAHGIGAAVGMIAPLAIGGAQASGLGWRYGMLAAPVLIATLYAVFRSTRIPGHYRHDPAKSTAPPTTDTPPTADAPPTTKTPANTETQPTTETPPPADTPPATDSLPAADIAHTAQSAHTADTADAAPATHTPRTPATPRIPAQRTRPSPRDDRLPARYWWAWLLIVCLVSVEFSLSLWASDLLEDRAGLSEGAAATAMTAVVAGLCLGRIVGGRLVLRFPVGRLYAVALAVNAAGFAALWLSTTAWLSFTGLFVAGLGMSVQFPLAMARSMEAAEGRTDLAASRSALATALAAGGAPFLLGLLADTLDTWKAFAMIPVFLLLAVPALVLSGRPTARARPVTTNPTVGHAA